MVGLGSSLDYKGCHPYSLSHRWPQESGGHQEKRRGLHGVGDGRRPLLFPCEPRRGVGAKRGATPLTSSLFFGVLEIQLAGSEPLFNLRCSSWFRKAVRGKGDWPQSLTE